MTKTTIHSSEKDKEEFIQYSIDKVYFYIESKFWSKLTVKRVQNWMKNFESIDEKYCAARLLDRFVFYSEDDTIRLLDYGINEIFIRKEYLRKEQEEDFLIEEAELKKVKEDFLGRTGLLPLSEGNPTDSSFEMARKISSELGFPEGQVISPTEFDSDINKRYDQIIILDDFIGTGDQIIDFWNYSDINFNGVKRKLYEISKILTNTSFHYLCLVSTKEGLDRFYSEDLHHDKTLSISCCEILKEKFRIFNGTVYFDEGEVEECQKIIKALCERKNINFLGFRRKDYAIAFHHGIPDASLPLFYEQNENWNYLIRNKKTKEYAGV